MDKLERRSSRRKSRDKERRRSKLSQMERRVSRLFEAQRRVRFGSYEVAQVKSLPRKEADDATASRRGVWKPAPQDDIFWDGENKAFRERELTPAELADELKARRRRRMKGGLSILSMFMRPNFKSRVRQELSEQGTYMDPLEILESRAEQMGRPFAYSDDESVDSFPYEPPPPHVRPKKGVLKRGKNVAPPRRTSAESEEDFRRSMVRPGRGLSMHRNSLFSTKVRRQRDDDALPLNVTALVSGLVFMLLLIVVNRMLKKALGIQNSILDFVLVLLFITSSLAVMTAVGAQLPERYQARIRDALEELL